MASTTGSTRLIELTDTITLNTKKIDQYFQLNRLPRLAFDATAPGDFPVPTANTEIQQARRDVVNATQELHDLMVGPRESLRWMSWSYNDNLSLLAIYHFRVADFVPLHGEASYTDIAHAARADKVHLTCLLRHAMTNRIFHEPREGYVAHTAASRLLLDDPQLNDWVGLCSSEFFQAAARTLDAMTLYPSSQEPAESGFSLAHCPGKPMFAALGSDPARAKRFGNAMNSLTEGEGYEVDYLVDDYPWADLGKATVVDVGGSHGFVCIALARKFPQLNFVVQDLPRTVVDGPLKLPAEFKDRIEFQAHDYYTEQPIKDAEVYLFRWICHNQSDKYGAIMLRALIPALKKGARIVISDNCLPKPNTADAWDEKITRTMDVTMLELLNARERDVDDWTALFALADPRFKFLGARQPKGSRMSIMEAVWEPEA